jgi:hypothetical protein
MSNSSRDHQLLIFLTSLVVGGAFDGSNSVIKSMVIDITDVTNMPKAYGYMPIPWMIGTTAG